jgi:hypothetical protein
LVDLVGDPTTRAALKKFLSRSKVWWDLAYIRESRTDSHYGSRQVSSLIGTTQRKWTTGIGGLHALPPKANETVGQYRARGGYLLSGAALEGKIPIDWVTPSWVGKHNKTIEAFHLYLTFKPGRSLLLESRIIAPSGLQAAWDTIVRAVQYVCNKISNDKLMIAAATAMVLFPNPKVQVAIAAYMAVAALCGRAWPDCSLVTPTDAGKLTIAPITMKTVPTYPVATIAWFDKKLGQFRIATPISVLTGLEPTHTETTTAATVPDTVAVVTRFEWEAATKPWYRRTMFLGAAAGVGALTVVGMTAAALRR